MIGFMCASDKKIAYVFVVFEFTTFIYLRFHCIIMFDLE